MTIESRSQVLRHKHRRAGLTLIESVLVVIIFIILIALLLPAVQRTRPHLPRLQCRNNLKFINQALQTYAAIYSSLPPAYTVDSTGRRLHSWRTLILPYLGQDKLYSEIDLSKPWDDPVNSPFHQSAIAAYVCPATRSSTSHTNYLAVVTPNSSFRETASLNLPDVIKNNAAAILIIEVPPANSVPWMAPFDADEALILSITNETTTNHTEGISVLKADGSVQSLPKQTSPSARRAMISVTDKVTTSGAAQR